MDYMAPKEKKKLVEELDAFLAKVKERLEDEHFCLFEDEWRAGIYSENYIFKLFIRNKPERTLMEID